MLFLLAPIEQHAVSFRGVVRKLPLSWPEKEIAARKVQPARVLRPATERGAIQGPGRRRHSRLGFPFPLPVPGHHHPKNVIDASTRFCLLATPSSAAFRRSVRGLFQIDSALARICFPGRDDADDFFAIQVLLTTHMHHEEDSLSDCANPVPAALTVDHAVFAKQQAWIGEYARCGFKIDASTLLLV